VFVNGRADDHDNVLGAGDDRRVGRGPEVRVVDDPLQDLGAPGSSNGIVPDRTLSTASVNVVNADRRPRSAKVGQG